MFTFGGLSILFGLLLFATLFIGSKQDSESVLEDLGYSPEDIADLPEEVQEEIINGYSGGGGGSSNSWYQPIIDVLTSPLRATAESDWTKEIIYGAGGTYSDIEIDASGNIHICFRDGSTGYLNYSMYNGSWNKEEIDATTSANYCSLAINSTGKIGIAYYSTANSALRFAAGEFGSWQTEEVETSGTVGFYTDIDIGPNDVFHIVHSDRTNDTLRHAQGTFGSWNRETIEVQTGGTSRSADWPKIYVDSLNNLHVAFINRTIGDFSESKLRYATGTFGAWTLENPLGADTVYYPAIYGDSSNEIHIITGSSVGFGIGHLNGSLGSWSYEDVPTASYSYVDMTMDNYDNIYIANQASSPDDAWYANGTTGSWSNDTVASVGTTGFFTEIAYNNITNTTYIVYRDSTEADLIMAYRTFGAGGGGGGSTNCTGNVSYNTPTFPNTYESYNLTLNYSQVTYPSADVNITWNGTESSCNLVSSSGDIHTWQFTQTIPSLDAYQAVQFHFNASGIDPVCNFTADYTQEIYPFTIDDCSSLNQTVVNISYFDEVNTSKSLTNYLQVNFDIVSISGVSSDLTFNFSRTNATYHEFCIPIGYNESVIYDMEAYYFDDYPENDPEYAERYYYTIGASLTAGTNISVYSLNDSIAQTFKLSLFDSDYSKLPSHYIQTQRYYVDEIAWKLVEVSKTDTNSETINSMELNDPYYRFVVVDEDGDVLTTTDSSKQYCTSLPCEKNVFVTDDSEEYMYHEMYPNVVYNLTFNGSGNDLVRFTYVDSTGETSSGRLWVYKNSVGNETTICNTTVNAASGTILCNLSGYTNGSGDYIANIYISQSPDKWFDQLVVTFSQAWRTYGLEGVFWAVFIIGMIALSGIWNPTATVTMSVSALIIVRFLGLINIPWAVIIGAVVVGAILIWRTD